MKRIKAWRPVRGEKYELATVGSVAVKLYRRQRAAAKQGETRFVFEVADYTQGARRLRSFASLAKARAAAGRIADQLATGRHVAAELSNKQAASFGRAVELLPPGVSLELAAATYAKQFDILGGHRHIEAATFYKEHGAADITPRTVAECVAELLAAKAARGKSKLYVKALRHRLTQFAKAHPQRDMASVTTADVTTYLDGKKAAPATLRSARANLFALFRFAESHGYIRKRSNPVADVERVETNGDGDIAIYTAEETAALLAAASKDFLPVVAIGAFAGVRTAEIQRLTWQDIDLAGGFIHVGAAKAKTRSRRLVPILPNLAAWLAPYAKRRGSIWRGTARTFDLARAATVEKAGFAWRTNALRHSFCSYRLAAIQNAAQVALEAGNSPTMVFRHYRELVKPAAAAAYFAIAPKQPANVVSMAPAQAAQ